MRRWWAIGAGVALAVVAAWWWYSQEEPVQDRVLAEVAAERARKVRPRPPVAPRKALPAPAVEPEPTPEPADGTGEVRCDVGDALSGWPVRLFDLADGEPIDWRIEGGQLVFEAEDPQGVAGLTWGFLRRSEDASKSFGRVSWSAGEDGPTCAIDHLPAPLDAAIYGRVRGAERLPEGTVFLEGCGLQERGEPAPIDVDGGFFLQAQTGRCSLRAWRKAGMLRIPGPWVEVDASAAGDAEIALDVPTFEPAGMGIGFQPTDGGVAVSQVHEGTPAAAAGLEPGDVITAIDGVGTDGMEVEDFLLHGIGPAGTDVQIQGQTADGEPFEVVVRRAVIQ